ncbi:MAG: hypothetical protein OXF97_07845 [Nitrospira sp.]|nr:hypothetical protein [Nitrospira sp.]MCY4133132.1 hypothetical protein [Nitrospira sp.]
MDLFDILAIVLTLTAGFSYLNHKFIRLPVTISLPAGAERDVILTLTYVVVVFSIVVQGLTMEKLVKYLIPR